MQGADGWRERELRARCYEAWELAREGSPYIVDAVTAIVEWWLRLPLTEFERELERDGRVERLATLMRETAPR